MADQLDLLLTACAELDEDLSNINRGDYQRHDRIEKHLKPMVGSSHWVFQLLPPLKLVAMI
jgi:hypothetical protein